MTIADRLISIDNSKQAIKTAIENKGVTVGSAPLSDYASKIDTISGGAVPELNNAWTQEWYEAIYDSVGPGSWVRNRHWLSMPSMTSSDQAFYGLIAVYPEGGNFVALTAQANYTVNWGNGVTENFSSAASAQQEFDYNDSDLVGTDAPVTFVSSTNTVSRTAHGYTNGETIKFYNIVTTTDIVEGRTYFVINSSTNSFQVSLTSGGSAVTIAADGSASLLPYKQAIVSVTPQSGQNLTSFSLNVKHQQTNLQLYNAGWLDILVGSPNFSASGFALSQNTATNNVSKNSIERIRVLNLGSANTLTYAFANLVSLEAIELPSTSSITNFNNAFNLCRRLATVPLFNTSAGTNLSEMFINCAGLITVPNFNTAAATNMSFMFQSCTALLACPDFNTSSVTLFSGMFNTCSSLKNAPLFNFSSATDISSMFQSCTSLEYAPFFNIPSNYSGVISNLFLACTSLKKFQGLTGLPTNSQALFNSCRSLVDVGEINVQNVTTAGNLNNMFANCTNLARIDVKNMVITFNVGNCKLNKAAIEIVCSNVARVTSSQTLTITGNYGVDAAVSKTGSGITSRSTTVTIANTSGLSVGMFVTGTGTGIGTATGGTAQTTDERIYTVSHGLSDGTRISFSALGTITGILTFTHYFVVNSSADSFQIAATPGGTAINLTGTNASVSYRYASYITQINTNVSVILSTPCSSTNANASLTFRNLDTSQAILRNWTITF
jgi:surface protein